MIHGKILALLSAAALFLSGVAEASLLDAIVTEPENPAPAGGDGAAAAKKPSPAPDPVLSGKALAPAPAVPAVAPAAPAPAAPAVAPVPQVPQVPPVQAAVQETPPAPPVPAVPAAVPEPPAPSAPAAKKPGAPKLKLTRDPVITAGSVDYDMKNGVVLFDRNVHVDAEDFQMHSDRVWVFLKGTNELTHIVAIGNVSITNESKRAGCGRAMYSREKSQITMFAQDENTPAWYADAAGKGADKGEMVVRGREISYNTATGVASVKGPVVTAPAAVLNSGGAKDFLESGGRQGKGRDTR